MQNPENSDFAIHRNCISRKHVLQKLSAIALLLIFAPFLAAIGACIAFTDGAPVLYRHRRVGFGGREFYCFKFLTMAVNGDALLKPAPAARPGGSRRVARNAEASGMILGLPG